MEGTLRAFARHRQNNWDGVLPVCEFAINNSNQASTGETPFYLNHSLHPITPSGLLNPTLDSNGLTPALDSNGLTPTLDSNGLTPGSWVANRMEALHEAEDAIGAALARQALARRTLARQALYADRTQTEDSCNVGDEVLVFRNYLLTQEARDRPADKLRLKWYVPFWITQKVAPNAFRLELPWTIKAHSVFNVTALRKYNASTTPGRVQPIPPLDIGVDRNTRYIVEEILSHRMRGRRRQYLVK